METVQLLGINGGGRYWAMRHLEYGIENIRGCGEDTSCIKTLVIVSKAREGIRLHGERGVLSSCRHAVSGLKL